MNNQAAQTMPELPEPWMRELNPYHGSRIDPYNGATHLQWYTADQMHAYARAALTREVPTEGVLAGWRVSRATSGRKGDAWEIYDETGAGGVVSLDGVKDWIVRKLLCTLSEATPTSPQRIAQGEDALPGMWSRSDFTGGDPDERSHAERTTTPAPQRHPDALEDGTLSKSTAKRLAAASVSERARGLLAAEYRTHGWHEDAGRLCMGGEVTSFVEDDALRVIGRLIEQGDEDDHVITELGRLLAEIAVVLKGPEPAGTAWSYHDLPEMVKALTTATGGGGLRELVERWRAEADEIDALGLTCNSNSIRARALELEAALGRGGRG